MSQTSTPTALEVSDAPDPPEPASELEALYRPFEAELLVPLRAEIGELMPAHPHELSGLPGWSRRHVVAHVHLRADALRSLVGWAVTGTGNPMYAFPGPPLHPGPPYRLLGSRPALRGLHATGCRPAAEGV